MIPKNFLNKIYHMVCGDEHIFIKYCLMISQSDSSVDRETPKWKSKNYNIILLSNLVINFVPFTRNIIQYL